MLKRMRAVVWQLIKEFTLPVMFATCLTIYKYSQTVGIEREKFSWLDSISTRIFFVSWLIAQIFRILKQQAVDASLKGIDAQIEKSLKTFESKTEAVIANITGGDSRCIILVSPNQADGWVYFNVSVLGEHPVLDLLLTVSLLNNFEYDAATGKRKVELGQTRVITAEAAVQHASEGTVSIGRLQISDALPTNYWVSVSARNGVWESAHSCTRTAETAESHSHWEVRSVYFGPNGVCQESIVTIEDAANAQVP